MQYNTIYAILLSNLYYARNIFQQTTHFLKDAVEVCKFRSDLQARTN